MDSLLQDVRILDLTDEKGQFCGRILGDLGAEVIKIEKPSGDEARYLSSVEGNEEVPYPEKSLLWLFCNANKKGITLDVERKDGKQIFEQLVEKADAVIESFPRNHLANVGLGYSHLSKINPRIVMCSITPFGQTGPYKDYEGSDLVCSAMSGWMYLCGDTDRPPVRVSIHQSFFNAGAEAAVGIMVALFYREVSGQGQYIDVAIRDSLIPCSLNAIPFWVTDNTILKRQGSWRTGLSGYARLRYTWPCKEGFISTSLVGGDAGARTNRELTKWMDEEGIADDFLKGMDWSSFDIATTTQDTIDRIEGSLLKLFMKHTKKELVERAAERKILLYPVSTVKDLVDNPQLEARAFWNRVEHPQLGKVVTYPGIPINIFGSSLKIRKCAPLLGKDNEGIYKGRLGLTSKQIALLKENGVI